MLNYKKYLHVADISSVGIIKWKLKVQTAYIQLYRVFSSMFQN